MPFFILSMISKRLAQVLMNFKERLSLSNNSRLRDFPTKRISVLLLITYLALDFFVIALNIWPI